MRVCQRRGCLRHDVQRFLLLEGTLLVEQSAQVATVDQLGGDEQHALVLTRVVDLDHVRRVQVGQCPRLALEPRPERRVVGQLRTEQLERDRPLEIGLPGLVDGAHAALADPADDLVPAERLALERDVAHGRSMSLVGTAFPCSRFFHASRVAIVVDLTMTE